MITTLLILLFLIVAFIDIYLIIKNERKKSAINDLVKSINNNLICDECSFPQGPEARLVGSYLTMDDIKNTFTCASCKKENKRKY